MYIPLLNLQKKTGMGEVCSSQKKFTFNLFKNKKQYLKYQEYETRKLPNEKFLQHSNCIAQNPRLSTT